MSRRLHRDPVATAATTPSAFDALRTALDSLTPREVGVLTLRFGLDGDGPRTLDEVGRQYGVTRERIRTIEGRALDKLRASDVPPRVVDLLSDSPSAATIDRLRSVFATASSPLVNCQRHGWYDPDMVGGGPGGSDRRYCRMCPCPLFLPQPIYCSSACRQAGYRFNARPGRTPALTPAQVSTAARLLKISGTTSATISASMGVSTRTLLRYLKVDGL